jgi:hypothetical protein
MNITELKMEMVEIISQTYDEPTVNRMYAKIHEVMEQDEEDLQNGDVTDESWWHDMPMQQKERILTSYKESFDPENWIDHEEMKKRHAKWLQK